MERYYMPEGEKSLFGLKAQYVAMASYIVVIVYRLYRAVMFVMDSDYLTDYELLTKLTAFFSIYYNWYEFCLAIVPVAIIILERKSKFVRFHCFQYLVMNLFLPLIYMIVALILSAFIWSANDALLMILFLYGVVLVFGAITIFMTFLNAYATYCTYKGRTTNFPIFSSIAYRLSKIG